MIDGGIKFFYFLGFMPDGPTLLDVVEMHRVIETGTIITIYGVSGLAADDSESVQNDESSCPACSMFL